MSLWHDIPKAAKVGAVFGLIPFVFSISSTTTTSGPSGATCSHMDIAALIGGAIALLAGGAALFAKGDPLVGQSVSSAPTRVISGLVDIALGAFQIVRGMGLVMGPCA